MKIKIGFDLSLTCSGYSIFDENRKLIKYGQIKSKTTLSSLEKIVYIGNEIYKLLDDLKNNEIEKIVIEDIFLSYFGGKNQVLGFANLGRLSGAVIMICCMIMNRKPEDWIILRGANVARPIAELKGNCQKAKVQVWMLQKFTDIKVDTYEALIEAIEAKFIVKDIDNKEYKKRMSEVSKIIENETEIGEDIADAVLLGYGA